MSYELKLERDLSRWATRALREALRAPGQRGTRQLVTWASSRKDPSSVKLSVTERIRFKYWLYWKYGGECAYCHRLYDWRWALTIDHIHPVSRGGALKDINNMVLACRECNRLKGSTWP